MPTIDGNSTSWDVQVASNFETSARASDRLWRRYATHSAPSVDAADTEAPVAKSFSPRRLPPALPIGGYPKRLFDIVVALCTLLLALPLMAAITILLCFKGGSPIFSHERVGFGGRKFRCHKFRTMVPDAGARLTDLLAERPDLDEHWKVRRKLPEDPRITRLGRLLRQLSLDELPQLFDVLCGNMSCVGPRPVTEEELEHYGAYVHEYHSARPGLTGLWQVSGRNDVMFPDRVRLDLAYIRNWSLRSDIVILARTPFAVCNLKTVY